MKHFMIGSLAGSMAGWVFVGVGVIRLRRSFHSRGVR